MGAQSYRDLDVYQLAHRLVVEAHRLSLELPKLELFEEGSQLRRAAKSIPANIVEGFGRRRYKAEFLKHLTYAHASCDETMEHLALLYDCGSLSEERHIYFTEEYRKLGRMLYRFIQSVAPGPC